ncbi:MAG: imidazolonepropionase, partial [candidate division Zixibacteria bacterium]|nr:imidazolonepropionase [candidate division Zixibacteria bacterium]
MAGGKLLIENIGQLVTSAGGAVGPAVARFEEALGLRKDVSLAIENGRILAVGKKEELSARINLDGFDWLDASGRLVTAGLVD